MSLGALVSASNSQYPSVDETQASLAFVALMTFPAPTDAAEPVYNSHAKQALSQFVSSSNLYSHLPEGTDMLPSQ
jgi:hypothetical protein